MSERYTNLLLSSIEQAEIICPVAFHAVSDPDAIAVEGSGLEWSYRVLDNRISRIQSAIRMAGLLPGDRLGIRFQKPEETIAAVFASLRERLVAAPLSLRIPAAGLAMACRIRQLSALSGDCPVPPGVFALPYSGKQENETGGVDGPVNEYLRKKICLQDPATFIATSGSRGKPRIAVHTARSHFYSAIGLRTVLPLEKRDRWLLSLPLWHVSGLAILFRSFIAGATVVRGRADRGTIRTRRINYASVVPMQLQMLVAEPFQDSDRTAEIQAPTEPVFLVGGGPIPSKLIQSALERGFRLRTTYGSTEMASSVTVSKLWTVNDGMFDAGCVLPYREWALSETGEILVRGQTLLSGYFQDGGIHPAIDGEGWFHTADRGTRTGNMLRVEGRVDSVFNSGGENIDPERIEDELRNQSGIHRVVVVPVHDERAGMRPVAFVSCRPESYEPDRWSGFLAERLPAFMIPTEYYRWPSDVQNSLLKDPREELRLLAEKLRPVNTPWSPIPKDAGNESQPIRSPIVESRKHE